MTRNSFTYVLDKCYYFKKNILTNIWNVYVHGEIVDSNIDYKILLNNIKLKWSTICFQREYEAYNDLRNKLII